MRLTPSRALAAASVALATAGATLLGAPAALAAGTVTLSALDAAYTQAFDTLAGSGTSSSLPEGWYLDESGTSSAADGAYAAGTGSSNAGNVYSFGASGSTDRAFGTLLSGSLTPTVGAEFTSAVAGTVTSVDVAYTGEQWRLGATGRGPDRLDFQYSTDATSLTSGTWTDVDSLDVASPTTGPSVGALDGNAAANRADVAGTISGLTLARGESLWLRWTDLNVSGSDDGLAVDDFSLTPRGVPGGDDAPSVTGSTPADGATGVAKGSHLTIQFSESVTAAPGAFELVCNNDPRPVAVSGSGDTYVLDPVRDFADGDACTLTVVAGQVSDDDAVDPPDTMTADFTLSFSAGDACAAPYTPAYDIQGSGPEPAITGQVTTQGVVVGDYEGPSPALRGFYLQDLTGDGDPETSDAVFVFNGNGDDVELGQVVRVTGNAGDFQDQTQVSRQFSSPISHCGTATVDPVDVTLPFASADFPERYEGMLVRMPQTLTVTEHFQLGRFGQVLMSAGGRLQQPTNVVAPGAAAHAMQAANDLDQILFDDASQAQNPDPILFGRGGQPLSATNTLRGGDTATGVVGVLTYTWAGNAASGNAFRLRPVGALGGGVPDFAPADPRPSGAPGRGSDVDVRVAGMNLLNFFDDLDDGSGGDQCFDGVSLPQTPLDCRGANSAAELARQTAKTVAAVTGTGADVVGVVEIENDGYGPRSAIQYLVDKLNAAAGAGTYAFVDADARTGQVDALGNDAIKVGLVYKPAVVSPVGQTAALDSEAFVNGGDSAPRNRPALAQAFQDDATGSRFVVSVNHLKSKGSACDEPDPGDGQGNCSAVRTRSAQLLADWLSSDPTGIGDPDALIVGDLNSYAKEDPVTTLTSAGFRNLVEERVGEEAYSYVFDGQWGYLDHALATPSMERQVSAVAEWHVNADEPSVLDYNTDFKSAGQVDALYAPDEFRISDHDPVLVDLDLEDTCAGLQPTILGTSGDDTIRGTNGPDVIMGFGGNDRILGGNGADVICGGAGDDVITGGNGDDVVHGGTGDDRLFGANGDDTLVGGPGVDALDGGRGSNTLVQDGPES